MDRAHAPLMARAAFVRVAAIAGLACVACGGGDPGASPNACESSGSGFATEVRAFEFGSGQDFGQDELDAHVLGGPRGEGCCAGSMHVTSLGEGGFVELAFDAPIPDVPGADFLVFENAFVPQGAGPESVYAELATVSVSDDGERWHEFPCTETEYPYGSCAGWRPVLANVDENEIDPRDPSTAGGDPFDLADLELEEARYVRIQDRADVEGTFDLDAVAVARPRCEE